MKSERWIRSAAMAAVAGLAVSASAKTPTTLADDEVRAIVAEMLADAEGRTSLLQSGGSAGHDGSFYLASNDGAFRLNVGGQLQFRYYFNIRDEVPNTTDEIEPGFQHGKTRLAFSGTVHDKWLYKIEGNFDFSGGDFSLEDAYIGYMLNDRLLLVGGNIKAPMLREELVDERYQLAIERSITNAVFNQGRSHAAALVWTGDDLQLIGAFSDGARSQNTDFNDPSEADYALSARVNWKFAGDDWSRADDFTSFRGSDFFGMFGIAGHWQQSNNTNNPNDVDTDVLLYTADLQLEGDGWNFFAAFIGRYVEQSSLFAPDTDVHDFAAVVQGGIFVTETDELFGRWDAIFPDDDRAGEADPFNTVTAGWTHYFQRHAAKFTVDVQYSIDDLTANTLITPDVNSAYLGSTESGEVSIRAQMQLLF